MNRLLYFVITFTLLVDSSFAQSNNDKAINIFTKEGHSMFFISDIDSITHDSDNIIIHYNNTCDIYSSADVDSINFSVNATPYYFPIKEEGLEGWTEGYMNNQGCFIVGRQEEDGGYFAFIGQKGQLDDGITLKFNDAMEIQSIYCSKGLMQIIEDESTQRKYALYVLTDSMFIEEFNTPSVYRQIQSKRPRRIPGWLDNALFWVNTGGDANNLLNWASGNSDLSTFLVNLVPNLMMLPSWGTLGVSLGLNYLDRRYQEHFYELLYKYMDNADIWIYVDDNNAPDFKIEATVEGLDVSGKPMYCSAHTGIAVGVNNPVVSYDNCDYILKEHETKANEVFYADLRAERKTNYYLIPFIVIKVDGIGGQFPLTLPKHLWGGPVEMIIHYGNWENICYDVNPSATTGDVVSKKKTSAIVNCSYKNVKGYQCGVAVFRSDGFGDLMDFTTANEDGERQVTLSGLLPGTAYDYWAYVIADGELISGEKRTFETDADHNPYCPDENHPHMIDLGLPSGIKWACCNVGAAKPEEVGGLYAWGETSEKDEYTWATYIHCDGSAKTCHHIGYDIGNTQYDVATTGGGRMPKYSAFSELKNCQQQTVSLNGVTGTLFTGTNGNKIFMPSLNLWASTASTNNDHYAQHYSYKISEVMWGGVNGGNRYVGRHVRAIKE